MIYDLLPSSIKILYCKMKTSLSLQGYLDALRELLEELEFCNETAQSYMHLMKLLSSQEEQWEKEFKNATKWIEGRLKQLKTKPYIGCKKVKSFIKQKEEEIKSGKPNIFQGNSYLEMQFNLLEQAATIAAKYGSYEALEDWCQPLDKNDQSISLVDDPLAEKNVAGLIIPDSEAGELLEKALGYGFIKVEVILPNEFNSKRQYLVKVGGVLFKYPIDIQECRNRINGRVSLEIQDKQPALLLHELQAYAYWRDWLAIDSKFPEQGSEKSLNTFYLNMTMKGNLHLAFGLKNGPEITKKRLLQVLDRFLIYVMQEGHQKTTCDKERSLKYAYSKVKELLMAKTPKERSCYTYDEITKIIHDKLELELLPFRVCRDHCKEACKKFAKNYGWKPKRKSAQQKRVTPTRW